MGTLCVNAKACLRAKISASFIMEVPVASPDATLNKIVPVITATGVTVVVRVEEVIVVMVSVEVDTVSVVVVKVVELVVVLVPVLMVPVDVVVVGQ